MDPWTIVATLGAALGAGYGAMMAGKLYPAPMHDAIVTGLLARISDRDQAIAFRDQLLQRSEQRGDEWEQRYFDSQKRVDRSVAVAETVLNVKVP